MPNAIAATTASWLRHERLANQLWLAREPSEVSGDVSGELVMLAPTVGVRNSMIGDPRQIYREDDEQGAPIYR